MTDDPHQTYHDSLSQEEKLLLILRDELYGGDWQHMTDDLRNRLSGKPYIYKLVHRIEEDLGRIEKLRGYEEKHGINLGEFNAKGDNEP